MYDGLVLAADSATTIDLGTGGHQVYNSATKIYHLHRRQPIGLMTWGLGNVGSASIATLAKDFRLRLMGLDASRPEWALALNYTLEQVANLLIQHVYDELYVPNYVKNSAPLGFLVAGYSAGESEAEAWLVQMDGVDNRPTPYLVAAPEAYGWVTYAQPEASQRLITGIDPALLGLIGTQFGAEVQDWIADEVARRFTRPMVIPSMPFNDAIQFARFVVETTVGYSRYILGPDTVGGQVEIAGVSRHEGFKWISRKYYYPSELNPKEPDHDA